MQHIKLYEHWLDDLLSGAKRLFGVESEPEPEAAKGSEPKTPIEDPHVDDQLTAKYNFHKIPDDKNNWRSAQLPKELLAYAIKKYGIKTIIRFNGDCDGGSNDCRHHRSDAGVSTGEEMEIASALGVNYATTPNGSNKRFSSTRDQAEVNRLLSGGNVLIHCAHGADRTGGNVGGYLHRVHNWPTEKVWNYTTQYNSWKSMLKSNPEGFRSGGYLAQANKFGVTSLEHAKTLAGL